MPPKPSFKVKKPTEKEPEDHSSGKEETVQEDIDTKLGKSIHLFPFLFQLLTWTGTDTAG